MEDPALRELYNSSRKLWEEYSRLFTKRMTSIIEADPERKRLSVPIRIGLQAVARGFSQWDEVLENEGSFIFSDQPMSAMLEVSTPALTRNERSRMNIIENKRVIGVRNDSSQVEVSTKVADDQSDEHLGQAVSETKLRTQTQPRSDRYKPSAHLRTHLRGHETETGDTQSNRIDSRDSTALALPKQAEDVQSSQNSTTDKSVARKTSRRSERHISIDRDLSAKRPKIADQPENGSRRLLIVIPYHFKDPTCYHVYKRIACGRLESFEATKVGAKSEIRVVFLESQSAARYMDFLRANRAILCKPGQSVEDISVAWDLVETESPPASDIERAFFEQHPDVTRRVRISGSVSDLTLARATLKDHYRPLNFQGDYTAASPNFLCDFSSVQVTIDAVIKLQTWQHKLSFAFVRELSDRTVSEMKKRPRSQAWKGKKHDTPTSGGESRSVVDEAVPAQHTLESSLHSSLNPLDSSSSSHISRGGLIKFTREGRSKLCIGTNRWISTRALCGTLVTIESLKHGSGVLLTYKSYDSALGFQTFLTTHPRFLSDSGLILDPLIQAVDVPDISGLSRVLLFTLREFTKEKCSTSRESFLDQCRRTVFGIQDMLNLRRTSFDWCPLEDTLCMCFFSMKQAMAAKAAITDGIAQECSIEQSRYGPDPALLEPLDLETVQSSVIPLDDCRAYRFCGDLQKRLLYLQAKAAVSRNISDEFIPGASQQNTEGLVDIVRVGGEWTQVHTNIESPSSERPATHTKAEPKESQVAQPIESTVTATHHSVVTPCDYATAVTDVTADEADITSPQTDPSINVDTEIQYISNELKDDLGGELATMMHSICSSPTLPASIFGDNNDLDKCSPHGSPLQGSVVMSNQDLEISSQVEEPKEKSTEEPAAILVDASSQAPDENMDEKFEAEQTEASSTIPARTDE